MNGIGSARHGSKPVLACTLLAIELIIITCSARVVRKAGAPHRMGVPEMVRNHSDLR